MPVRAESELVKVSSALVLVSSELVLANAALVKSLPGVGVVATPATRPGVPTSFSATAGEESISMTWGAAPDGGSPVTSYDYRVRPDGGSYTSWSTIPGGGSARSFTITNLTAGTAYRINLRATNAVGSGLQVAVAVGVTPLAASADGPPASWWGTVTPYTIATKTGEIGRIWLSTEPAADNSNYVFGRGSRPDVGEAFQITGNTFFPTQSNLTFSGLRMVNSNDVMRFHADGGNLGNWIDTEPRFSEASWFLYWSATDVMEHAFENYDNVGSGFANYSAADAAQEALHDTIAAGNQRMILIMADRENE